MLADVRFARLIYIYQLGLSKPNIFVGKQCVNTQFAIIKVRATRVLSAMRFDPSSDFMFQLNEAEFEQLKNDLIFQNGISSWGGTRKYLEIPDMIKGFLVCRMLSTCSGTCTGT